MIEQSMFTSAKVEAEVGGAKLTFYPLSVGATIRAKTLMKSVARAFAMFSGDDPEQMRRTQAVRDGDAFQNTTEPISTEHLEVVASRRAEAVDKFFDALDQDMVAALVLDSLRKDPLFSERYEKPGDLFEDSEVTTEIFSELVVQMLKANKKIADPFRKMASAFMQNVAARFAPEEEEGSDMTIVAKPNSGET